MTKDRTRATSVTCHCGAVSIGLTRKPSEITECNCSLCRSYGVLWTYHPVEEVIDLPDPSLTQTYAWKGENVDFHRCRHCGCVTHWVPRDKRRATRGINARLLPPGDMAAARLRHLDGADTGKYLD